MLTNFSFCSFIPDIFPTFVPTNISLYSKKMETKRNTLACGLLFLSLLSWTACENDAPFSLVDPEVKTLQLRCGQDVEIPVNSLSWQVESVKMLPDGQLLTDLEGRPIALEGNGKIEASNGWLALSRDKADALTIHLKENFNRAAPRQFEVCLNENGRRDYIAVTQQAAQAYRLVATRYEEMEEERDIYVSDRGCSSLILENPGPEAVWRSCSGIFKDVVESSEFTSDAYGAFDWMGEEAVEIAAPELLINDTIYWNKRVIYKEGLTTLPYIKDIEGGDRLLLRPYTTYYLTGQITYCKRRCRYTFTLENEDSGSRFDIEGYWTQIVPICSHTTFSDEP